VLPLPKFTLIRPLRLIRNVADRSAGRQRTTPITKTDYSTSIWTNLSPALARYELNELNEVGPIALLFYDCFFGLRKAISEDGPSPKTQKLLAFALQQKVGWFAGQCDR
jgi:hypothetical protein